jgi:6-phosphogluconolactonase
MKPKVQSLSLCDLAGRVPSFFNFAFVLGALMLVSGKGFSAEPAASSYRVYVGTYTNNAQNSEGIYLFDFDAQTGKAGKPRLAGKLVNPSFLVIDPQQQFLYAVNEVNELAENGGKKRTGAVSAMRIEPTSGELTEINHQPSQGRGPCHVSIDHSNHDVLVANYGSGSAACFPRSEDGSLRPASAVVQHEGHGTDPRRQEGPHAHSINVSPDNRFAIVCDLGLDQVKVYRFDPAAGTLAENDPPFVATAPGAGPRHFAFHPNGKFAYNNNELDWTLVAYRWNAAKGVLTPLATVSTIPAGAKAVGGTAEVAVHPNGKFVYVSNRGPDTIAIFRLGEDGKPEPAGFASTQGKFPRHFAIDPTGKFLLAANQDTGTIVVFSINEQTGALTPTGDVIEVPAPVCVRMIPQRG